MNQEAQKGDQFAAISPTITLSASQWFNRLDLRGSGKILLQAKIPTPLLNVDFVRLSIH